MASIHGNLLEVSVVGCNIFSDEVWVSGLDSLCVGFEYGANKSIVFISPDGGILPTFEIFILVEDHREIKFVVWKNIDIYDHNHPLSYDNFMGSGKVHLHNVLSQGYDASSWPLKKGHNSHAGVLKLRLKYANANRLIDPPSSSSSSRAATTEKMAPPYGYNNNNNPYPYFAPQPPPSNYYSHPYYNYYFPPPSNYSHYSYNNYPPPPTSYPYYPYNYLPVPPAPSPSPATTSHPSPPAAPATSYSTPPAAKPSFLKNFLTASASGIVSGLFVNMFDFFGG